MSAAEHTVEHGPITLEHGFMDDWFVIVSDDPGRYLGRINGADIEGTRDEMLSIADAIQRRDYFSAKRCAVDARAEHGDRVLLWSPRNSVRHTAVPRRRAEGLAETIRTKLDRVAEGNGG